MILIQIIICDNLFLPFRDESIDAILSLSVIHHFSTLDRRFKIGFVFIM